MDGMLLQFANLDSTTKWLLAAAVALTIFYAIMRPMRRKKKDPLAYGGQRVGLASQRAVEHDMTHLLVQLSDMARQVTAQLDTRTAKLEVLIKDADERLAALKEATAHVADSNVAGHGDGNGRDVASPASENSPAAPVAADSRHVDVYDLADQKLTAQQIAQKLNRPQGEIELILALRERAPEAPLSALADAIKPRKKKKVQ
ncbi:MAG TPA: hypothetical protein VG326_13300 [Tepidisphaeraceae bacterium]|jgi:hypothetical protein|nr:hypothetical protein [Tepidisphaeraceae bacterium]